MKAVKKISKNRPKFDVEAHAKIHNDNCLEVVSSVYGLAVELAIKAKYGSGILTRAMLSDDAVEEMRIAMTPLIEVLRCEAIMSVGRVLNAMLETPSLRDYIQRTTAANIGKGGGRRTGGKRPHFNWLEGVMRANHMDSGCRNLKEHVRRIRLHGDIHVDSVEETMTLTIPGGDNEGSMPFCMELDIG